MNLESIETFSNKDICFVRVTDLDGDSGWGMTAPRAANITALVLHQIAANIALEPFDDYTAVADEIIHRQYKYLGSFLARAAGGIDTALWDLIAKKRGVPVAELIGKKRDSIDLYASSMRRNVYGQEEANRLREIQDRFGYRAVKIHPGIPVGRDLDHWEKCTEDLILTTVKTVKPGTDIFVDVNGNYSVEKAIKMANFMHELDIKFFEEPCPYWEYEKTKAVREACSKIGLPIAGGEQDYINTVWDNIINRHILDILQPDILCIGGFSRSLRVSQHAAKKGLEVTPHTSTRTPILLMGLHYISCIDNPYSFLEYNIEDWPWQTDCYEPQIEIKNGYATVPTSPGWGFEPSKDFLNKAQYNISKRM